MSLIIIKNTRDIDERKVIQRTILFLSKTIKLKRGDTQNILIEKQLSLWPKFVMRKINQEEPKCPPILKYYR